MNTPSFVSAPVFAALAATAALTWLVTLPAFAQSPGESLRDCADCPEMMVIPPGTFVMGSNHEEPMRGGEMRPQGPEREVTIGYPLAVGKYEVTVGEWRAFAEATGHPAADCSAWGGDRREWGHSWQDPGLGRPAADNDPVVCVYWTDAVAYTNWLSEETENATASPPRRNGNTPRRAVSTRHGRGESRRIRFASTATYWTGTAFKTRG